MRCLRLFLLFVSFEGEGERSSHADSPTESLTHEVFTSNGDFAMYPILCPDLGKYAIVITCTYTATGSATDYVCDVILLTSGSSCQHQGWATNSH